MEKVKFSHPLSLGFIADHCSANVAKQFRCFTVSSLASVKDAGREDICVIEKQEDIEAISLSKARACIAPVWLRKQIPDDMMPLLTKDFNKAENIKSCLM